MSAPELTAAALTHHPTIDNVVSRISHRTRPATLTIVPYDPSYPSHFARFAHRIRAALGPRALVIAHAGSTAIPNMPSKAIIDIDLVVADPTDEASYVSALVGAGWEGTGTGKGAADEDRGAGLQFMSREPEWHEHRFFVCDDQTPTANVHVFGPGCPEVVRHRMFREWLLTTGIERDLPGVFDQVREATAVFCTADQTTLWLLAEQHPEDFEKYAAVKREASEASLEAGENTMQYNARKEPVIQDILNRAFKAQGLLE